MSGNNFEYPEAIQFPAVLSRYVEDENELYPDDSFVDTALEEVSVGHDVGSGLPPWIQFSFSGPYGPRVRIWLTPANKKRLLSAIKCAHLLADAPQQPPLHPPDFPA